MKILRFSVHEAAVMSLLSWFPQSRYGLLASTIYYKTTEVEVKIPFIPGYSHLPPKFFTAISHPSKFLSYASEEVRNMK
ncbi:hypothetical protein ACTXT7_015175 [Hymenolepis weldensis]